MSPKELKDSLINQKIARRVDGLRIENSLTQQQLAARSGVPMSNLKRILKGSQQIGVVDLGALAGALGTTGAEIYQYALNAIGPDRALADVVAILASKHSVSEGSDTTDELAERRRKQEEAARMTVEELEREPGAATRDAELDSDEPDVP